MRAYLETCFRMRWLWVCAALVWIGVVVILVRSNPPEYEVVARVWVRPPIAHALVFGAPPTTAPSAWQQTRMFRELLVSETFLLRVIQQTPMRALATTDEGRAAVRADLRERLTVKAYGDHLFELRFVTRDPASAPVLMRSVVAALLETNVYSDQLQSTLSAQYYSPLLQAAERAWLDASTALRQHLQRHPEYLDPETSALAVADPELLELQGREQRTRVAYEELAATVRQIQMATAAQNATASGRVVAVDQPIVALEPLPGWQVFGMRVAAVTALVLSAAIATVLVATWTDPTARHRADLAVLIGDRSLGTLPPLRRAWWTRWRWRRRPLTPTHGGLRP